MDLQVVVGLGPVGRALVAELRARDLPVRAISRRKAAVLEGVNARVVDVTSPPLAREALAGAAVVYDCTSAPPTGQRAITAALVEGAAAAGARLVVVQSGCLYRPGGGPIGEDHPLIPGPRSDALAASTALLLEAHRAGKVRVAIGRASDLYGPGVRQGAFGERVFPRALRKERIAMLGDPSAPHTFTFVNDLATALVTLGERTEALGALWHVPSAPALAPRQLLELVFEAAFGGPQLRAIASSSLRLGAIFSLALREDFETALRFERPYVLDAGRFERALGARATPHREATGRTLSWWRELSAAAGRASSAPGLRPATWLPRLRALAAGR